VPRFQRITLPEIAYNELNAHVTNDVTLSEGQGRAA